MFSSKHFQQLPFRPIWRSRAGSCGWADLHWPRVLYQLRFSGGGGGYNTLAGKIVNSQWYSALWHPVTGIVSILRDGILNGIFLGYNGASPVGGLFAPHRC